MFELHFKINGRTTMKHRGYANVPLAEVAKAEFLSAVTDDPRISISIEPMSLEQIKKHNKSLANA